MSIKNKIKEIYKKNSDYANPESATNQAESLKSLSSDLYTDSKRFIYELLQNADDSVINGKNVEVIIKLFNDTLVIGHTGKIFTDRDIQGICSINNGTKISDTTKTGYKGIGFKSVFGQSNEVIIFTDNEYFKFDENHKIGWKEQWEDNQTDWEDNNNRKFLYPWQIIPININTPNNDEIQEFLSHGNWNVATIIKASNLEEIKETISELSSDVNMFLFLKNINSIKFEGIETILIKIERHKNELVLKQNDDVKESWLIKTIESYVPNELKNILKADANIPKKLQDADSIELTLAIKKTKNRLEKLSHNENLLYAYLPTDEKRYRLPILVNTTFLTSANRESLHENSKWNQWLFKSISMELFKWIAELIKGEYYYQAYSLIPSKLNVDDNLSKCYNEGIDEAISSIPFILSKKNELLKVNEVIMDETKLSETSFIGSEIIKKFVKNKIGNDNQIVKSPFIPNISILNKLVNTFTWNEIPAFFTFEDFKLEHTANNNVQLVEYFKNEVEIVNSSFPKDEYKNWSFILNHKGKLSYLNKICFPKIDDTGWNNLNSDLDYVNEELYNLTMSKPKLKKWLEKLGVKEKTDITYLENVIIPNADTYITIENYNITINYLYSLYSNEDIKKDNLNQLSKLKLITQKGTLIPASECYFSDKYNPRLEIETVLDEDIYLSEECLKLSSNKDDVKRFFKLMGIKEGIELKTISQKTNTKTLMNKFNYKDEYFLENDKKFKPYANTFTADEYKNILFMQHILFTVEQEFSKLFWNDLIVNTSCHTIIQTATAYWGHVGRDGRNAGNNVENYPKWYIKNNKCLPTKKGMCEKSTNIFLNTNDIETIAGKYLPIFDGVELNQEWKSFFKFKTVIELDDYLELLTNIMNDKDDENKIKKDNKKKAQLVYEALFKESINWSTDDINKVKSWAIISYLADEEDNIALCNKLKYYADGNNSIFQNTHKFIALNAENKSHQNAEIVLEYLGIEILRQDNFSINIEGEERKSDLKYKLESIFPYLEKWIQSIDKEFDFTSLNDKLNKLQINEASKLSLMYDETILKYVKVHLEKDELLVTTPWSSNTSMLELPRQLCAYFKIKGYEDKLAFLLKSDNELEIKEYFTNEEIELPIDFIPQEDGENLSKNEAITTLGTNEKEFEKIRKISNDFYHTSESSIDKLQYIQKLLQRSEANVIKHLNTLPEYNCDNVDSSAQTVLSGITKYGKDIYIIPRPSDNGKIIIYYPSELDTLEYSDSELWYEDGTSIPKKLTFGKVLRDTKINQIPIIKTEKEEIIDIMQNSTNEEIAYEVILPSPFDIAKTMASFANTNGGYFILGCSKESGVVGLNNDFNVDEQTKKAIDYSNYFDNFRFNKIKINDKTLVAIKVEKSNEDILIKDRKYIRMGSMITEATESNNKPLIITEGKTDWKHIKKALARCQKEGSYCDLDIEFQEYENEDMGDVELDRMVQTYHKTKQSKKHIFIFDRDNNTYVKKYAKEEFNNHNNNIYSFCIPKISNELDRICIEFYYKKEDLKTTDKDGRRIFLGEEFFPNGNSICGKYQTSKRNTNALDILDGDKKVYLKDDIEWKNNVALSKNNFTNNIINDIEGFNNFNIEYFKLIFSVIEKIVNDK